MTEKFYHLFCTTILEMTIFNELLGQCKPHLSVKVINWGLAKAIAFLSVMQQN